MEAFEEHVSSLGARELPVSTRHALLAGKLRWDHRDPFDRMLAAHSMLESLPLVTTDRALSAFDPVHTIW